jgi:hypothetical protein
VKVANPQRFLAHAALVDEMKCEAAVYAIILADCADLAPRFIGYGTIAYASSLAVEFEGASFKSWAWRTCRANYAFLPWLSCTYCMSKLPCFTVTCDPATLSARGQI